MTKQKLDELIENKSIWKEFEEEMKFQEDSIVESLGPINPSPLKSAKTQIREKKQRAKEIMDLISQDITIATQAFINECSPEEKMRLDQIFDNMALQLKTFAEKKEAAPIPVEDCEFMEEIAKRKLLKQEFQEAGRMFRFILQLNFIYSGAWVGWAISEQEQQHWDVVDQIFYIATTSMPHDSYIALFAADFYTLTNQLQRAVEILQQTKTQLIENNQQTSKSFELVNQSLERLQSSLQGG